MLNVVSHIFVFGIIEKTGVLELKGGRDFCGPKVLRRNPGQPVATCASSWVAAFLNPVFGRLNMTAMTTGLCIFVGHVTSPKHDLGSTRPYQAPTQEFVR